MKQQVIFLNGGNPKENYKDYFDMLHKVEYNPYEENFKNYNKTLGEKLGEKYEYFRAPFPNKDFADYNAWKIMFEKMLPFLDQDIILIAHSLGGSFILKYLGENEGISHPKTGQKIRIKKLFLLAVALHDSGDEVLGSFSFDIEKVYFKVSRWAQRIYIYHSQDDTIVPFEQSLELKGFFPEAEFREFYDRGHFYMEAELPELVEDIKN